MPELSLLSPVDVQQNLADYLQKMRKASKLSREALAQKSAVPASTIKKFESTGQISLRQFILLWQTLDELERLNGLSSTPVERPQSIEDVLRDNEGG